MHAEDYVSVVGAALQRAADAEAEAAFARLDAKHAVERASADIAEMSRLLQAATAETNRIKVQQRFQAPSPTPLAVSTMRPPSIPCWN